MADKSEATIIMSVKHVIWGTATGSLVVLATIVATIWGLWTFTMGNLQDDVKDIRAAVTRTQDATSENRDRTTTVDSSLRVELANLTGELKVTNAALSSLSQSVSGLDGSLRTIDEKITQSIERQVAFETHVLVRLGQVGVGRLDNEVPIDWEKSGNEIIPILSKGGDPLPEWYKLIEQK